MQGQLIEKPKAEETRRYGMLVGGEWLDARSGKTFESINPYTGRVWATAPEAGEEEVDRAVRAAREAFEEGPWGRMTGTERARLIGLDALEGHTQTKTVWVELFWQKRDPFTLG